MVNVEHTKIITDATIYEDFKNSVRLENRFILSQNKEAFLLKLSELSQQATLTLPSDTELYRARIANQELLNDILNRLIDAALEGNPPITQESSELPPDIILSEELEEIILKFRSYVSTLDDKKGFLQEIYRDLVKELEVLIKETFNNYFSYSFQGFDAVGSTAPPPKMATEGRLNPKGISYLYTSSNKNTAIHEVKPYIGQTISVARLKTTKQLKVLDLTAGLSNLEQGKSTLPSFEKDLISVLAKEFSKPNHGNPEEYAPTQYIAEYIKETLSFDGVKF